MGLNSSKTSKRVKRRKSSKVINNKTNDFDQSISMESPTKFDETTINILRKEFDEHPDVFILNNLIMSVMFFENYKKEFRKLFHSNSTKMEKELNPKLMREETINCITPDAIFDEINKNIRFRPLHGPRKDHPEPLVAKRIYVVSDNVEVLHSLDVPDYSAIDKPNCQARMEDAERKGFVKLKQINSKTIPRSTQTNNTIYNNPTPCSSSSQDDDYAYIRITEMKTPKPINIETTERRNTLPQTCFTLRKVRKYEEEPDTDSDDDDDDDDDDVYETAQNELDEEKLYENVSYISSKGFMQYFQNVIFPNSLGKALGFEQCEIQMAKSIPGTIFCNLLDANDYKIPCEVIPSIAIQWPAEQTFEFDKREERPTIFDRKTGILYRWPTDEMIMELKSLNCVLVPKGFFQKRGENTDSEIEWEIAFPKAERYIETRMSLAQIRCFLCLLALYKTFIEPKTAKCGLLVEHIRTHMYWECEANFKDWPEHRLGTKMMKLLENLEKRLAKGVLRDFFIKSKNVFENIPRKYLLEAQRILHNILESPTVHFIAALRNLRYTNGHHFYPPVDFNQLYRILTLNDANNINKHLLSEHIQRPSYRKHRKREKIDTDRNSKREQNWRIRNERINREKYLEKQRKEKEKLENLNSETQERKNSIDSINFDWKYINDGDILKNRQILIFFLKHFIEVAKKSRSIATNNQVQFYLKQAYYLCRILKSFGLAEDSKEYFDIIKKEEIICKRMANRMNIEQFPPPTPTRNSIQPFNFDITQQVVNGNSVNLNNLTMSFNKTSSSRQYMPSKLKKTNGIIKGSRIDIIKSTTFSNETGKFVATP